MKQRTLDGLMYMHEITREKFAEGVEKITGIPCPREVEELCGQTNGQELDDLLRYLAKEEDYSPADIAGIAGYLNGVFLKKEIEVYYSYRDYVQQVEIETHCRMWCKSIGVEKDESSYSVKIEGTKTSFKYPFAVDRRLSQKYYFKLLVNEETHEPEAVELVIRDYGKSELVLRRTANKKSGG